MFVRLIHDGQLRLEQVEDHSEDELRGILDQCGQSVPSEANKVGDGQRARQPLSLFLIFFMAITSKQDDHKTRQGHSVPVEWRSGVQVSCDKSNASCPHPRGAASLL